MDRYNAVNKTLTLQGHLVYSVATISTSHVFKENEHDKGGRIEPVEITPEQKIVLDLVHLQKILESDAIVVIGWRGGDDDYAGESTRREVAWAVMNEKQIFRESAVSNLELLHGYIMGVLPEVLSPDWPKTTNARAADTRCGDPDCAQCAPPPAH